MHQKNPSPPLTDVHFNGQATADCGVATTSWRWWRKTSLGRLYESHRMQEPYMKLHLPYKIISNPRPSHLKIPGGPKMTGAALRRRAIYM